VEFERRGVGVGGVGGLRGGGYPHHQTNVEREREKIELVQEPGGSWSVYQQAMQRGGGRRFKRR